MNDLPPRKTLVMILRTLKYAQTPLERREIVRAAQVVRQALRATISSASTSADGELSPIAKRILSKCAGQKLSVKVLAMACSKSPEGSSFKKAMQQLKARKLILSTGKGMYRIQDQGEPADLRGGKAAPIASN